MSRRTDWRAGPGLAALVFAALACGAPAAAQAGASPLLPAEHWAVRAAWRAEALGLAPGFFPAERGVPRAMVAAALEEAGDKAESGSPQAVLVARWLADFRREFAEHRSPGAGRSDLRAGATVALGAERWAGRLSPAEGLWNTRLDPAPLPDRAGARFRAAASAVLGGTAAIDAELQVTVTGAELHRWGAAAAAGPLALSVGRSEVGYGTARTGGIVLSTGEPIGRVELRTIRPMRLPLVGRVTGHTFAARMDDGRHVERPWLWGARVALQPHLRLTLGLNRASVFGGDSTRVSAGRVAGMLVGVLSDDFENQIVSLDARWRLPTDRMVPATVYLEWGAEDGAGGWIEQPGRTVGVLIPALPSLEWAAVGVEATRLAGCCGHGTWYTHATFRGNWARGDALLGHPLGGEGTEVAAYAEAALPGLPIRLDGRFFVRDRAARTGSVAGTGNLLAPAAAGRGMGGELRGLIGLGRGAILALAWSQDAGTAARARRGEAEIRYHF